MADWIAVALRFLHILFGTMWLGAVLVGTFVLMPNVMRQEGSFRRTFFLRFSKPMGAYGEISAILAIVFGVALYAWMFQIGTLADLANARSLLFLLALLLALLVWILGTILFFPRIKKAGAIMERWTGEGTPPAELIQVMKPLPALSMLSVVLLLIVFAIMILAVTNAIN